MYKTRHQKICWSIARVYPGLYTITNTLRVREQDRTEQGSLPAHPVPSATWRQETEENTIYMYFVENEDMEIL